MKEQPCRCCGRGAFAATCRSGALAEQYDAPWLYGVAAITNLARVGSRQHWVSDTVAGSVLGYAIGKVLWQSSRTPQKGAPRVMIHPSGVNVAWELN